MNPTFTELAEKANRLYEEARVLLTNADCTAEDMTKSDALRDEADTLKARASALKKLELAKTTGIDPNPAPEPTPDGEFKSWKEYVGAVSAFHLTQGQKRDPRLKIYQGTKDLSGETGAAGGLLVPTASMTEVMSVAAPMAVVRPLATQIPMSTRNLWYPKLNQKDATAGKAHYFGGIEVFWQSEGSQIGSSQPAFTDGELIARELVGYTVVNNSLLADVPALAAFLGSRLGFPGAITWAEEYAFLQGDGVGKPMGIINSPVFKKVSRSSTSHIKYDDLAAMQAAFMGANPIWIASQSTMAELMLMNGPSGNASYLWGDLTTGRPDSLLGKPIKFVDNLPALGSPGDIMLVDLSYYLIGTLTSGTSIEPSAHENFKYNKTSFRIMHRVDGQPWLDKVITLPDGATELSPFVGIAA